MQLRDLTGQSFGRLTVIRQAGTNRAHQAIWHCVCTCGVAKDIPSTRLVTGNTKSCGCLRREVRVRLAQHMHETNKKPDAALNRVWYLYRARARNGGFSFTLPKELFRSLLVLPCFYCSRPPENASVAQSGDIFHYNGLDKKTPKLGYTPDNCVPCCKICNFMKNSLTFDEFLKRVHEIAERHPQCLS